MSNQQMRRRVLESFAWAIFLTIPFAAISSYGQRADHKAFHEAVQACAKENNITLPTPAPDSEERPPRPSEDVRKVIDACLTAKGIELPKHPPGRMGPPPENDSAAAAP